MQCPICGSSKVRKMDEVYHYAECGLDYVYLKGIPHLYCQKCEDEVVEIPREDELLAKLGEFLVTHPVRLGPQEIRYLRKLVGWSQEELGRKLDIGRVTINRWENEAQAGPGIPADILIRIVWTNECIRQSCSPELRVQLNGLLEKLDQVTSLIKQHIRRVTYDAESGEFQLEAA